MPDAIAPHSVDKLSFVMFSGTVDKFIPLAVVGSAASFLKIAARGQALVI
jgi:hypothetical protein